MKLCHDLERREESSLCEERAREVRIREGFLESKEEEFFLLVERTSWVVSSFSFSRAADKEDLGASTSRII